MPFEFVRGHAVPTRSHTTTRLLEPGMTQTRIGIIGAGRMGREFATRFAAAGHDITITAKGSARADAAAVNAGSAVRAVPRDEIARDADVLVLVTPYGVAVEALRAAGDLRGKTIIDVTNPIRPDLSGLLVGHTTSAAEEIQKAIPDAKVVKAFNTIFSDVLAAKPSAIRPQAFYAGDDAQAKGIVRGIIESIGFEPMDAGPLVNARYLEPLGMLTIYLGYGGGLGRGVAPWIGRVI
jgi:predicted dinucleotide-binding enzyme